MDPIKFKVVPVRAAAILTSSYVAGTILENCHLFNKLALNINFTKGELTNSIIKIEGSLDGTTYRTLTVDVFTAGANTPVARNYTLTASLAGMLVPFDIATKYIKISAIGTGTATDSSLAITAILQ
jgi:hypothetical protein